MRDVERELDPAIVRAKMKEFEKGEAAFFAKYGGGPSTVYDLIGEDGYRYPPAAIVQAALGWNDVRGGVKSPGSAGRALRNHGFRVVQKGERLKRPPSDLADAEKKLAEIAITAETDAERKAKTRVGAGTLRKFALLHKVRCEVTGIRDEALLRVSHIAPWSIDRINRLNPENVILLAVHWDAAFDRGLVTFDQNGVAIYSSKLTRNAIGLLRSTERTKLTLNDERAKFLSEHRIRFGFQ